jgi:hypothetical protein
MKTLVLLYAIFSPGNGHIPDRAYWSNLTCDEIYSGFIIELAQYGGGVFSFDCQEFTMFHEADLELGPTDFQDSYD